jgi:flavin-dependent dehydrogenase
MVAEYDIITIGGGLAGAALAKVLAERGLRVLVLERETTFRDRVRGEQDALLGRDGGAQAWALRAAAGDLKIGDVLKALDEERSPFELDVDLSGL